MREEVRVRYLGDDIVEVPGVGRFQRDTIALVPRAVAFDLLRSDDWAVVAEGPPAIEVRLHIGQWDGPAPEAAAAADADAARRALEPASPEDFGDLPPEGPDPDEGFPADDES